MDEFSLFDYGNQAWADPVITSLLNRSDDKSLEALTATSPSLALLVLQKTGGILADSTGGKRLVWLLHHREKDCVPVKELRLGSFSSSWSGAAGSLIALLSSHPQLAPSLQLLPKPLLDSIAARSPQMLSTLSGLTQVMFGPRDVVDEYLPLLSASRRLAVLELDSAPGSGAALLARLLAAQPCALKYLQRLTVNVHSLSSESLAQLHRLKGLESLALSGLRSDEKLLADALPELTKLTKLELKGATSSSYLVAAQLHTSPFCSSLSPSIPPSVRELVIKGTSFSDADVASLARLTALESLAFDACSFSKCTRDVFKSAGLSMLRAFALKDCVGGVSFGMLGTLPNLQRLSVAEPSGAHVVGRSIMGASLDHATPIFGLDCCLPSLLHLSLGRCKLGSSLEPLSALTNLRSLSLQSDTLAPDLAMLHVFSSLRKLKDLSFFLVESWTRLIAQSPTDFTAGLSFCTRLTSLVLATDFQKVAPIGSLIAIDYFSLLRPLNTKRLRRLFVGAQAQEPASSWALLPSSYPNLTELLFHTAPNSVTPRPPHVKQALQALPSLCGFQKEGLVW